MVKESGKTVLIAEGNDVQRELIKDFLKEDKGHKVIAVKDIETLAEAIRNPDTIDLIILGDIFPPEQTGIIANMVVDTAAIGKPMVVLTTNTSQVIKTAVAEARAVYLEKPVNFDQIETAMRQAESNHGRGRTGALRQ